MKYTKQLIGTQVDFVSYSNKRTDNKELVKVKFMTPEQLSRSLESQSLQQDKMLYKQLHIEL